MLAACGHAQPARSIFACDLAPASRTWLQRHCKPGHLFADITKRVFGKDYIVARTVEGHAVQLTRHDANLDLYVAGFMCTPFSDKGQRAGWKDASTKYSCAVCYVSVWVVGMGNLSYHSWR